MKLHAKLMLGFGSVWIVFLAATAVALLVLEHYGRSLEAALHSNFDSVVYCEQIKDSLGSLNQLAMAAIWSGKQPPTDQLRPLLARLDAGRVGQNQNITLPGEAEFTNALFTTTANFEETFSQFLAAPPFAKPTTYQDQLYPRFAAANNAAQSVIDLNLGHLNVVDADLRSNLGRARVVQICFVAVGGMLALISVYFLGQTILAPLRTLMQSAQRVEAGDFNQRIPVLSRDELGELASAFNAMAAKLEEFRRLDHARLLRLQQTTQLAIDSLPDAVAVFNPAGQVDISNHQARLHFHLEPNTLPQQSPAAPPWLKSLLAFPLAQGLPVEPEGYASAIQLFDGGHERFLLPRAVPMFGQNHAVIGVVVTLVDVTRLRQADELKSGLIATVSHELKTPLAAARFSVQLLAQETVAPLTDAQRRLVKAACDGTDRLHKIIENLLSLRRIEEGKLTLHTTSLPAAALVDRAVDLLRPEFASHGLHLNLSLPADLPPVSADPDLIGHVFSNLLSNTLKFVSPPAEITLSATASESTVTFTLSDTGPGIPPEHLPRLFTRYFRAAAPATTPGAGLGLSIAKQIIEAHGGQIHYHPTPTHGATFTFTLPCAPNP